MGHLRKAHALLVGPKKNYDVNKYNKYKRVLPRVNRSMPPVFKSHVRGPSADTEVSLIPNNHNDARQAYLSSILAIYYVTSLIYELPEGIAVGSPAAAAHAVRSLPNIVLDPESHKAQHYLQLG